MVFTYFRFDSEYGGRSFGFTSDAESDLMHDDFCPNDLDDLDSDVANILDRVQVHEKSANKLMSTIEDKKDATPENDPKTETVVAASSSLKDDAKEDDPVSSRTDASEISVTLVTDSVTDEPTLTQT